VHAEDGCTLEEARTYRLLLRSIGPERFIQQTILDESISAKKLLTAFGIRPPSFLEDVPDEEAYIGLLRLAFQRELSKRLKLPQYNSIDDAVQLLKSSKNIIVLTGAGISTSLGIPDFRSKDVGLYAKLEHLGLSDPQDVFEITLFREDPSVFYSIARDILPSTDRFSPTHAFIRLLQDQGKLLTNYTQNIDNIEAKAGIDPEKLIQCHGSFVTASCVKCRAQVPGESIFPEIIAGDIPRCKKCLEMLRAVKESTGMKRKRSKNGTEKKRQRRFEGSSDSSSDEDDNIPEPGVMKPDITFFGEALPDTFSERLTNHDRDLVDLVIVIGTSLKVAPVSEVVPYLPANIPQMYISRTPVSHVEFDVDMLGDCDVVVAELCRRAGWDLQHEMIPKDQKIDISTHEALPSRHFFRELKDE
jgi:NAD+-dependent protein deacetylase SIR2